MFHVLNRGVRRARLFEHDGDYRAFISILAAAQQRVPVQVFAYCVMPNHFHLVASPTVDRQLSEFMRWMTVTHSKRWHVARGTTGTGCVYQGRFKAFPVQTDEHFLTVCRYVERNALRARLVARAEDWAWSSLYQYCKNFHPVSLSAWPVPRPDAWLSILNGFEPNADMVRATVVKSRPFGSQEWVTCAAKEFALTASLRRTGRPRTTPGVVFQNS